MGRRTPKAWQLWLLSLGLSACDSIAVEPGSPAIIDPPSQCSGDPTCYESSDFPDENDLTEENSSGLRYSGPSGGLVMNPANEPTDSDGDGVPDIADDCSGMDDWITCNNNTEDDGVYRTLFYDVSSSGTLAFSEVGELPSQIFAADVYFLVDASDSMDGEIGALQANITSILSAIQSRFPDVRFGVGFYRDYALDPHADPFSQSPYHHILDMTTNTTEVEFAINALGTAPNLDNADAGSQAMYMVATGEGVSTYVPNRLDCPSGTWGYPCFRDGVFPVIVNVTDDRMINGPDATGPQYGNPPFDGVEGGTFAVPPAYIMPLMGSDDTTDAIDLGDLAGAPVTLMGMSNYQSNFVDTSAISSCTGCGGTGCDEDWKDVVVKFHWSAVADPLNPVGILYAWNTHFPGAYAALWEDSAAPSLAPGSAVACSHTDLATATSTWGQPAFTINTAVEYYGVIDGLIPAAEPTATPEGAYQLLLLDIEENLALNSTWFTHNGPITWTEADAELNAVGMTIASIITPRLSGMPVSDGLQDALDLAVATNSVDASGTEYVQTADFDGTGLSTAISDVFDQMTTGSRRDVVLEVLDDPATPSVDERDFVTLDVVCPTSGALTCTGKTGNNQCDQCEPGAPVEVNVEYLNDFVMPSGSDQLFETEAVISVGGLEQFRVPFRFVVPAAAASYTGSVATYQQEDIDAFNGFCDLPNERPDWGIFNWTGTISSDEFVQIAIYTANTSAELDTVTPVKAAWPPGVDFDVGFWLPWFGTPNGLAYLRLVTELHPSSDGSTTPVMEGFTFEFTCTPAF